MSAYDPHRLADREALAHAMCAALSRAEFHERLDVFATERVFERQVVSRIFVRVYTSIVGDAVRAKDADAIRISLIFDPGSGCRPRGLRKAARVFRTGEIDRIVERMLARMREQWKAGLSLPRCHRCGTVTFQSKRGNDVCAMTCWLPADAR